MSFFMVRGWIVLFLCIFVSSYADTQYPFTNEPLDVIIPCTEKDLTTLEHCIAGILKNGRPIRRVIIVSNRKLTNKAEWFDEKKFPFCKADVALQLCGEDAARAKAYLTAPQSRTGWYYQQLLKFYAPFVIPGISANVLILDSDTIFLRPVHFLNSEHAGLYNTGTENHQSYFEHAKRLIPGFRKRFQGMSGVCHHMVFQRCVLEDLFRTVESTHHTEFWKAFCRCVSANDLELSGASEYEIYFNFLFSRSTQPAVRTLRWDNVSSLTNLKDYKSKGYHYISCHAWMRQ
jgi:hypothetical protein